jgi:ribose 5-phosphate isomerase B
MRIAIGSDHLGFTLKGALIAALEADGHVVLDLGSFSPEPVDYPDYARVVGQAVLRGFVEAGVLVCGSGVGAAIAASKMRGVRASVCHDTYSARQGVEHDDMNVLCMGARIIGVELAVECAKAFLGARFSGEERHRRRLAKVLTLEAEAADGVSAR